MIPGPLQMIGAGICAVIFRVNLPLALFVTLYTNPVTIVPLYLLSYQIGRMVIGQEATFLAPPDFSLVNFVGFTEAMQSWMLAVAKPLGVGIIVLASGLAILGYFATKATWRLYLINAWRRRKLKS